MVSIIIPVLNEAAQIEALLQHLRRGADASVAEILVVDGGSTDGTVALAGAAGATLLHCPVCSRAAQMNMGARAAKGTVLYFVHADTRPPLSYAQDIRAALEAGYRMGCYRYRFDSPSILLKINAFFNRFQWLWCQGGDKTFFIQRDFFEEMGGYDEYYSIMEEYDFLRRAMPKSPLRIIPKYAVVSARKYAHNGWLRVQWANAVVFRMFQNGASPEEMRARYKSMLR
jgi:rSAM/selenodomain-associated transferase 2